MSESGGTIKSTYVLDISDVPAKVAQIKAQLLGVQQSTAQIAKTNAGVQYGPTAQNAAQVSAYAQAQARLAQVENTGKSALTGLTQAERIYQDALSRVNVGSIEAIRLQTQLQAVQNRIGNISGGGLSVLPRSLENFGPQALQQIQSGLLGIVGPTALVTAGFSAAKGTVDSFVAAFKFKGELDATTQAITTNLEGVRDQSAVFREAEAFADKYRLRQKETADILAASTDTLRSSTASVSGLESALLRLQSRDVSKPVSEAARALRELQSGDVTSIKELFNVPARDALRMKNEIAGGADAVQVLTGYLDRAGVGAGVLENRAKGIKGAFNEAAIAQERLQLAQAKFAEGPGSNLLGGATAGITDITRLLGDGGPFKNGTALIEANQVALLTFQAALATTGDFERALTAAARAREIAYEDLTGGTRIQTEALQIGAGATDAATQAALFYANHARAAGNAADEAAGKVDKLTAAQLRQASAQGLAAQRAGERQGGDDDAEENKRQQNIFGRLAQPGLDKAAADAKRLADLKTQNDLINAKNSAAKIAILKRQLAATTDPIERQQIQNQIDQEKRSGAGRVGAAQTTGLQLQNVEENTQAALLKAQREGAERLRDSQLDFDIRRSRSAEDFQEDYRKLLEKGQHVQAAELKREFEKDQRRAGEDFRLQQRRTVRNNAESTGDTTAAGDRRSGQIEQRAALRGVGGGGASAGGASGSAAALPSGAAARVISITFPSAIFSPDGQKLGDIVYPFVSQRIDDDLAIEIRSAPALGGSQTAVAGQRP